MNTICEYCSSIKRSLLSQDIAYDDASSKTSTADVHDNLSNEGSGRKRLSEEAIKHILRSDGFYLSTRRLGNPSSHEMRDMDVNHRGGLPGFVRVMEDGLSVVIPDYSGNRLFQSLGNIHSDGLAGKKYFVLSIFSYNILIE